VRILIVGRGPDGLYVAQLLRRAGSQHQITALERNPANATFGFGVVVSDGALVADDASTVQALEGAGVPWDSIETRHAGELVRGQGSSFVALPGVLQRLALDAGAGAADLATTTENVGPCAGRPSPTGRRWGI